MAATRYLDSSDPGLQLSAALIARFCLPMFPTDDDRNGAAVTTSDGTSSWKTPKLVHEFLQCLPDPDPLQWPKSVLPDEEARACEALRSWLSETANVNHVPVMTGGVGRDQLGHFYGTYFIPCMPPDTAITPLSRTVGANRIVDEFVFSFTHSLQMDWLLPGVAPTNRHVEVVKVVIVEFEVDKIVSESIHWDQASVLVQLGLLDPTTLPVAGAESARKAADHRRPSNGLMKRQILDPLL